MERRMEKLPETRGAACGISACSRPERTEVAPMAGRESSFAVPGRRRRLAHPILLHQSPCPASVHPEHGIPHHHQRIPCASWPMALSSPPTPSPSRHTREPDRPFALTSARAQPWRQRTGGALRALPAGRGHVLGGCEFGRHAGGPWRFA